MKIVCLGGGPAGLYFAISMKLHDPSHQVTVVERNRPDDTFGWGVVLSDETLENLRRNDAVSARAIKESFAYWDYIDVRIHGRSLRSGGHGFCGIGRKKLLNILQDRAAELGVEMVFQTEVEGVEAYADADLIVASDGINSKTRERYADVFQREIDIRKNKFIWLGTHRKFDDAFTFTFKHTDHGWIWAHAYQFDTDTATFIVECSEATWAGLGFDAMDQDVTIAALEKLLADDLGGHALMSNARHLRGSAWLNFPRVLCGKWSHGNIVLMGDAAHTAHFSIGSGTKLVMEDAIQLAEFLHVEPSLEAAFDRYEDERRVEVLRLQSTARNSTEWFEDIERYVDLDPVQFTYGLLTRSQRVSHENLRLRDKYWLEMAEAWFEEQATGRQPFSPRPPMFTPFELRGLRLENRVVVSPMDQCSARDGTPDKWHLVHYGSRSLGGAALVYTEMTCVSPEGRITPGCTGMYAPEHEAAWREVVDFVHANGTAKFAIQLGHSGPKGSTKLMWDGMDEPLVEGNWPVMGPSPVPWSPENQVPHEMTRADMEQVTQQFVRAAEMSARAGFDVLELHYAHGYLLSAFVTPVTNKRTDEYGGSLENRMRYPIELFHAVRAVWPDDKPISVRISSHDWVGDAGIQPQDAVGIAEMLNAEGVDIVDVSAG